MPRTFAVYVSGRKVVQENLKVGLQRLTWGWRDSALKAEGRREMAELIAPGDLIVVGTGGPNPRVKGDWPPGTRIKRVLFLRATTSLYQGGGRLWPDEVAEQSVIYPNRIDFEVVYDAQAPDVVDLEPEILRSLKFSSNTHGSPAVVDLIGFRAPKFTVGVESNMGDIIDHEGAFDAVAEVLVRREQRKLRARKFGNRTELTCALCGRTFPARLVRAAHVKRRSQCTSEELVDLSNVIPACTLGCDEMFEHGYIAVDASGQIIPRRPSTGDLHAAAQTLAGRSCPEHTDRSRNYFAWHHADHQT